jgi:hypothetical protein
MKKQRSVTARRILFALTLVCIIANPAATMRAQSHVQDTQDTKVIKEDSPGASALAGRIEGVWDVRVTILQCDTHDPIRNVRAMNMFIHGGTLTETATSFLRGSSLGAWNHVGAQEYAAVFRFFRFNPDGSFAGTTKVTRKIELSRDANEFTATSSVETFDTSDNLIATGCATEAASRLE